MWDVDAALFSTEDQGDRVRRAINKAGAVPNAFGCTDQFRLTVYQAQNLVPGHLRAGVYACGTTNAFIRVYDGME
jgi:hypothetical protein